METTTVLGYETYQRARNRVDSLERYRLGDCMMDTTGYMAAEMTAAFSEEWFRGPIHRAAFRAIKELIARGARDVDVGTVVAEMQRQGTFQEFNNAAAYVSSLTEGSVPPPSPASRLFRLSELRCAWRELDEARQGASQ